MRAPCHTGQSAIHARLHVHVALIGRAEWLSSVLKDPRDVDVPAAAAAAAAAMAAQADDGIIVAICLRVCMSVGSQEHSSRNVTRTPRL